MFASVKNYPDVYSKFLKNPFYIFRIVKLEQVNQTFLITY